MRVSVSRSISLAFVLAAGLAILLLPGAEVAQAQSPDTTAPTFVSAAANGTELTVTFNEDLDTASVPAPTFFFYQRNGESPPKSPTAVAINGRIVTLTLSTANAVAHGQTVRLIYAKPNSNPLKDLAGNAVASFTNQPVTNNTPAPDTPTIESVAIASVPSFDADGNGAPDTYGNGDKIAVEVTFSEAVTVTGGTPRVRLDLGPDDTVLSNSRRSAALASGSGTATLRFEYTVASANTDADGVWVQTQSATDDTVVFLNGATIASAASMTAATLTKSGLPTSGDANHKVDGTRTPGARVNNISVLLRPALGDTYGVGEVIFVAVFFNENVFITTTGSAQLEITVGANKRQAVASLSRQSLHQIIFEYTVVEGDLDTDGISIAANKLSLNGGFTINDGNGNAALLFHEPLATQSGHKVDWAEYIPRVNNISVLLRPALGDTYGVGEVIFVAVFFNENVFITTTGSAQLEITVGANKRQAVASLSRQSLHQIIFEYTVVEGDLDTDGISIAANKLSLNGGFTINDGNGNAALLFHEPLATQSGHKVNGGPLAAPTLSSATAAGPELVLTYNEALAGPAPDKRAFTVRVDGRGRTVSSVALAGNAVTLTLASAVREGQAVTVSYRARSAGGNPIRDAVGNQAADFANLEVTVAPDTTAPTVVSAEVNGTELTLTFSEDLDPDSTPAPDAFTVLADAVRHYAAAVVIAGRTVTLTLDTAVVHGQAVTVAYTRPAANRLRDRALTPNEVVNLSGIFVTNNTPDTRPDPETAPPELVVTERYRDYGETYLIRAVVYDDKLTLTYDEALNEHSTPAPGAFTVRESEGWGGELYGVTSVAVADRTVTLTLSKRTSSGGVGRFEVSYRAADAGGNRIRDIWRNEAADFDLTKDETLVKRLVYVTPAPNVSEAEASGRLLTLTFDRQLDFSWEYQEDGHGHPGPEQFVVTVDGVAHTPTKLQVGGRKPLFYEVCDTHAGRPGQ